MPARRQAPEIKRRIPRQARAAETAAAILEGAAQILEANGLAAFTTNAVAERAGVSIGTLYQYFADKNAILLALAKQQVELGLADIARALRGEIDPTPAGRVRAMVRAAGHAFRGRERARKAVMEAVLAQGHQAELMAPVVAFIARHHPLAIVPVAILVGGIGASGGLLQRSFGLPDATVNVLQGILFVVILASDTLTGRLPRFRAPAPAALPIPEAKEAA